MKQITMVNQLDPLTTSPITPTSLKITSAEDFAALKEQVIAPYNRLQSSDTTPKSSTTRGVEGIWTDYDPQINVALDSAQKTAKFLRIGQLVRVKLVVVMGTGGYAYETFTFVLPFPPTDANGNGAYALGTATSTEAIAGVRQPLWTAGGSVITGVYLYKNPVFGGQGNFNGRLTQQFLGVSLGHPITSGEVAVYFLKYHANV